MKKSFSKVALGLSCLLGLGAGVATGITLSSHKKVETVQVKADDPIHVSSYADFKTALAGATSDTVIIVDSLITVNDNSVLDGHGCTVRVEVPYLDESGRLNPNCTQIATLIDVNNGTTKITPTIKNMTFMGGIDPQVEYCGVISVANQNVMLTLENVTITRSYSALFATGLTICKNCRFVRNASSKGVGAIWATRGLVLDSCVVAENMNFKSGLTTSAGAIYSGGTSDRSQLYINNSVIVNNYSIGSAGAINIVRQKAYILNTIISGNVTSASSYPLRAGGITVDTRTGVPDSGKNLYMANSIVTDNYYYNKSSTNEIVCERNDICLYGASGKQAKGELHSVIYSADPNYSTYAALSLDSGCKKETSENVAACYRYDGLYQHLTDGDGFTYAFAHPLSSHIGNDVLAQYVAVKADGPASSGGVDTCFEYSFNTTDRYIVTKASYGGTKLGDLTASSVPVETYFGGGARTSGVYGPCGVEAIDHILVKLNIAYEGDVSGLTIYGDAYHSGSSVTFKATPPSGKAFAYWDNFLDQSTNSTDNPYTFNISADMFVNPIYLNACTVSYNINGGSGTTPAAVEGVEGGNLVLDSGAGFSRTGYTFGGWNTNSSGTGTNYDAGSDYTLPSSNVTLYAKWTPNQYTVTLNAEGGVGGDGTVDVTYNSNIPSVTVPTKDGYEFIGYFDAETGGTKYINADGTSAKKWDKTDDSPTLYAQWLQPMVVSSESYVGDYDGNAHSISIQVTTPESDYTIVYRNGTSGAYNLTSIPTYTNVGTYTTGFKVSKSGYADYVGEATVTISKVVGTFTAPTAKADLHYTGEAQALVEAGSSQDGTLQYSIGDTEHFSADLPEATEVGEYVVYYKLVGDGNHNDSEVSQLSVSITENNKTELQSLVDDSNAFYEDNNPSYPEQCTSLKEEIDYAQAVLDEPNVTEEEIETQKQDLYEAYNDARVDVCEEIINGIGEVTTESESKIKAAEDLYNSLPEEYKTNVTNHQTLVSARTTYDELVNKKDEKEAKNGLGAGAVVGIVLGALLLALCGAYFLLFFVFNKWIKVDEDKAVRVFPFALGKKDKAERYFAFPCKFYFRERSEVFKTKEEALK